MANYVACVRTNYFHVKDEAAFYAFMKKVSGESDIHIWKEEDPYGRPVFGFGCEGTINGLETGEDGDCDYDAFIEGLQGQVAEGDAILLMQTGHEKLRYVTGIVEIVTNDRYRCVDMTETAKKVAAQILENPMWDTREDY